MPRKESKESICERIACPRCSEFLSEQAIAKEGEPCSAELECETIQDSSLSSVPYERNDTYEGKEVEEYSCLSIIQREISFNRYLEIGREIVRHYDQEERATDGAVIGIR